MKTQSYSKGRGIKAVSKAPGGIIKLIGWIDGHISQDVAMAHIDKYLAILAKHEKDEALLAEEALREYRKKGNKAIFIISHTDVGAAPESHSFNASHSEKRGHAKALNEHARKAGAVASAREALPEIDSAISSTNLVFEERLEKTRNKGLAQIEAYIKGVRSGKIHNFYPDIKPDDTARIKYYSTHKENDDIIHKYTMEAI